MLSIWSSLAELPDPRNGSARRHNLLDVLMDVLTIALTASIRGAESCVDFADFARDREALYREFLALAAESALLVSDSGGVQEEASIIKRPVLVVRNSTERPEILGTFAQLVPPGPLIAAWIGQLLADIPGLHARLATLPSPYGDGTSAPRSAAAISILLSRPSTTRRPGQRP